MYAILDIETTGGQFNEEGITEIAIYKFDGHEVVDQFISLVNPEIPIQPFVVNLTGISNAMLTTAPKFFEIAKRIIEITSGCILVAHNATFDYRILRTEFRRLGYDFQINTLCTVELAQKLIPEQPSYSLGKLVRGLGIPMADRHRANGDAMATVKLFKLLLSKDLNKEIVKELIKSEVEKGIEPKLHQFIDNLPSSTGIYYIHKDDGSLVYIGKSRNMKKHLNQHFVGNSRVSKKIQNEVFTVTYEETGSELVATLKEKEEIQLHRPACNRLPKKRNLPWGIFSRIENGFIAMEVRKADYGQHEWGSFTSEQEALLVLTLLRTEFNLCGKYSGLACDENGCEAFQHGKCSGACNGNEALEQYNSRVEALLRRKLIAAPTVAIVDRGRSMNERCALLIENGIYKGYAFVDLNYQVNNLPILRNLITPMHNRRETKGLIQNHILKSRSAKIITF
ncbi:MAG: exonuclease [Flavobacterium sp.]|nr:MAG: exonuclease [Flavobacterium sp.]